MTASVQPLVADTALGPIEYASVGEGWPVLALHGAMGGWDQGVLLARTVGPAARHYLAVSRPGYLATPLANRASPERQADLYAALLDTLGMRTVAVLAISGGGPSAVQFAVRHPDRTQALVLCSTCGTAVDTPIPWSFHLTAALARWPTVADWLRRRALRDPLAPVARSIADSDVRARTLGNPEVVALMQALIASTFEQMARRLPGTWNDIAVTRQLALPLDRVRVSTLIVHGTADRMVPYDVHAVALANGIPGAESLTLAGGEHVAIFTHRAEVQARVAAFLEAHV